MIYEKDSRSINFDTVYKATIHKTGHFDTTYEKFDKFEDLYLKEMEIMYNGPPTTHPNALLRLKCKVSHYEKSTDIANHAFLTFNVWLRMPYEYFNEDDIFNLPDYHTDKLKHIGNPGFRDMRTGSDIFYMLRHHLQPIVREYVNNIMRSINKATLFSYMNKNPPRLAPYTDLKRVRNKYIMPDAELNYGPQFQYRFDNFVWFPELSEKSPFMYSRGAVKAPPGRVPLIHYFSYAPINYLHHGAPFEKYFIVPIGSRIRFNRFSIPKTKSPYIMGIQTKGILYLQHEPQEYMLPLNNIMQNIPEPISISKKVKRVIDSYVYEEDEIDRDDILDFYSN